MCAYSLPIDYNALATQANPYPIYQQWVDQGGLFYDAQAKLWIASSAEVITQVLTSPHFSVRPIQIPVPENIDGSIVGDTFSKLIRMNDGDYHHHVRQVIVQCLADVSLTTIQQITHQLTTQWITQYQHIHDISLSQAAYHIPTWVIASLLGMQGDKLAQVPALIHSFVKAISPLSQQPDIEQNKIQLPQLIQYIQELMQLPSNHLLTQLQHHALQTGIDDAEIIIANAIGLLSQTYDATAGLIGNTMLVLSQYPALYPTAKNDFVEMLKITQETARYDSSVQNTRRFAIHDAMIGEHHIQAGDAILILLAAANRDPKANSDPTTFNPQRIQPKLFTYSAGIHQCPGDTLSLWIASTVIQTFLQLNFKPTVLRKQKIHYYPSINGRIPIIPALSD